MAKKRKAKVKLDDNGNVETPVDEKSVNPGDVVSYTLESRRAADWQFGGFKAVATDGGQAPISKWAIVDGNRTLELTMGNGKPGATLDLTLLYCLDISEMTLVGSSRVAPDSIWKSNDPVIKFR